MVQLHQDKAKFDQKNIQIIAICPEDTAKIEKYLNEQPLDFTLVADPKHIIANAYNQQVRLLKLGRMPAQILLDQEGKMLLEHHAKNMSDIIENDKILKLLEDN